MVDMRAADSGTSAAASAGDERPLKEGWLKKMGHNLQRDWRPRYVVLQAGKLAYYKSYEDFQTNKSLSTIELVASLVRPLPGQKGRFEIETATKVYTFQARNDLEMHEWTNTIAQYITATTAKIVTLLEVRYGGLAGADVCTSALPSHAHAWAAQIIFGGGGAGRAGGGRRAGASLAARPQGEGGVFSAGDKGFASGKDALATLRENPSNRSCADCGEAGM